MTPPSDSWAPPSGPPLAPPPSPRPARGGSRQQLWIGVTAAVVLLVIAVAFLATRGGSTSDAPRNSRASSAASSGGAAAQLVPPLRFGDFVAECGAAPCTSVTTVVGQPSNIFSQPYLRASSGQSLLFNACDCGSLGAADRIQRPDLRGQFGDDAAVVMVDSGGTSYACMTGSPPPRENGKVIVCSWNAGPVVFALEAIHALDPNEIIAIAPLAQAAASGG
jgi:hypothetical protein